MEVRLSKLWKGMADIRDYTVEDCLDKNYSLRISYDGEVMILSPEQLKNEVKAISKPIKSKFDGTYRLYSYKWEPKEISY
jgi:hypothetical protein